MNASVLAFPAVTAPTLAQACAALEAAKLAEHDATLARHAAEQSVLALCGELPAEGTTRRTDGEYIAVVITSVRRVVDGTRLAEIAGDVPEAIRKRLIRWKPELVTAELRWIQSNEPEIYSVVAQAIEAKPAKPALKIERVKEVA